MCVRPLEAINLIRKMLQVEAQLIPMSEEPASLAAMLDGQQVVGETTIDALNQRPDRLMLLPEIHPTKEALEIIKEADLILLGPGSFMTSVLPALLMKDVARAVNNSSALKVFIGNISPEQSSVRAIAVSEKLSWMKTMTGVYPDILLWPEERSSPEAVECAVMQRPLSDETGAHSRKALREALDQLVDRQLSY